MRVSWVLGLIALIVLQCLDVVTAAPRTPLSARGHGQLRKRVSESYCSGEQNQVLNEAIEEVKAMMQSVAGGTKLLHEFLEELPHGRLRSQSPKMKVVFRTFETIFGRIEFGPNAPQKNSDARQRVSDVYEKSYDLWNSLINLHFRNVQFFCDDTWLKDPATIGATQNTPYIYWDGRTVGSINGWLNAASTNGICRDNPLLNGFTYPQAVAGGGFDAVTMCQTMMPRWVHNWNQHQTLTEARKHFQPPSTSLQDYSTVFSSTLLHEMMHASNLFPMTQNSFHVDHTCEIAGKDQTAYGWKCVVQLGLQRRDIAIGNADSFMYYAMALYLDQNDWHTGLAEPLPN